MAQHPHRRRRVELTPGGATGGHTVIAPPAAAAPPALSSAYMRRVRPRAVAADIARLHRTSAHTLKPAELALGEPRPSPLRAVMQLPYDRELLQQIVDVVANLLG
ncbi:hypothetical protein [Burkholderia sp. D-99]|uniref:hypothetical protein n=1 Tax=Burkholderia sp. D-99 TaxID=2717316 RepID=UPI00142054FA|nr:hypothetical protein [Burkholderia sp. D-99]NHV28768.1 hypothetical protein [Burkholderia sp. D-99]